MVWQKHRNRVWEGSWGDLPQPPARRRVGAAKGQPIIALPRWGSKPPEEGSSRQVLPVFLAGAVRTINHCIEPKSNKQAQRYVVQRAAGMEPNGPHVPSVLPCCRNWCLPAHPAPNLKHQQHPGYVLVQVDSRWI